MELQKGDPGATPPITCRNHRPREHSKEVGTRVPSRPTIPAMYSMTLPDARLTGELLRHTGIASRRLSFQIKGSCRKNLANLALDLTTGLPAQPPRPFRGLYHRRAHSRQMPRDAQRHRSASTSTTMASTASSLNLPESTRTNSRISSPPAQRTRKSPTGFTKGENPLSRRNCRVEFHPEMPPHFRAAARASGLGAGISAGERASRKSRSASSSISICSTPKKAGWADQFSHKRMQQIA